MEFNWIQWAFGVASGIAIIGIPTIITLFVKIFNK